MQAAERAGLLPDDWDVIGNICSTIAATSFSPQNIPPEKFRPKIKLKTPEEIEAERELQRSLEEMPTLNIEELRNG